MSNTFRIAIWAAVSTDAQAAADKISLPDQIDRCRQLATQRSWRETAGPYTVPGASRTRYVNLRDAERDIPQLAHMLDDAQAGRFNLLLIYDYNRFRDLLDPVAKTLSHYGVQIFSLNQPVEPVPPGQFSPYSSDTSSILQGMSKIISQAQIADLRRKYRMAMPRRIADRGLPIQIPYGYRKPPGRETDRSAIPVIDPVQAPIVIEAKNLLLDHGYSLKQIAEHFNACGYTPPRAATWYPQTIRDILRNPFYFGVVRFGLSKTHLDPRTGKRSRDRSSAARSQVVTGPGKHQPLWDRFTHAAILDELARRARKYPGKVTRPLTSLLECGICNQRMWIGYNGAYQKGYDPATAVRVWRCSSKKRHVVITDQRALEIVAAQLRLDLINIPLILTSPPDLDHTAQLDELTARRRRLEDAYLAGAFDINSFKDRALDLEKQIGLIHKKIADQAAADASLKARQDALQNLATLLKDLPNYLAEGDPQTVNRQLHALIHGITIHQDPAAPPIIRYK